MFSSNRYIYFLYQLKKLCALVSCYYFALYIYDNENTQITNNDKLVKSQFDFFQKDNLIYLFYLYKLFNCDSYSEIRVYILSLLLTFIFLKKTIIIIFNVYFLS
jgi:hypothetical protein